MKFKFCIKRLISLVLIICLLPLGSLTLSATTVFAADKNKNKEKKRAFREWDEKNQSYAWESYKITDWEDLQEYLTASGLRSSNEYTGKSRKVEKLRKVVEAQLMSISSGNKTYTNLMLAYIHAISNGNPDKNDPCQVQKYILGEEDPNMTPERSIKIVASRLIHGYNIHNLHFPDAKANVYSANARLKVAVESIFLGLKYAEETEEDSYEHARKWIKKNKNNITADGKTVCSVDDMASFANTVLSYYKAFNAGGGDINYVNWALEVAADNSHGYSQPARTGPDYDCSSLVYYSLVNSGYEELVGICGGYPFTTYYMCELLEQAGFTRYPYSGMGDLQEGDILVFVGVQSAGTGHTEIYIGNGQNVGAHSDYDGVQGDSSGSEISTGPFYEGSWDYVMRLA